MSHTTGCSPFCHHQSGASRPGLDQKHRGPGKGGRDAGSEALAFLYSPKTKFRKCAGIAMPLHTCAAIRHRRECCLVPLHLTCSTSRRIHQRTRLHIPQMEYTKYPNPLRFPRLNGSIRHRDHGPGHGHDHAPAPFPAPEFFESVRTVPAGQQIGSSSAGVFPGTGCARAQRLP